MPEQNHQHRVIRPNHSNALPRYLIFFDCETQRTPIDPAGCSFSHSLRLGCAITCRLVGTEAKQVRRHTFHSKAAFWKIILAYTKANYTTWIVAHNALFDFIVSGMPERFEHGELSIDWPRAKRKRESNQDDDCHAAGLCIIDSPPTIIATRVGPTQGRCVFVDMMNYFPAPLSELGKACGIPKTKMPDWASSDKTWAEYCMNDCEIVYRTFLELVAFVRDRQLGMFRYTAPAQAMAAFRHGRMPTQLFPHDNPEVKAVERHAYYGGRTDCWRLGRIDEAVCQLDVSSLFPSVMASGKYPVVLDQFELADKWTYSIPDIKFGECVAEVQLNTERPIYPKRTEHGVIYPTGIFKTTLCGQELAEAASTGELVAIRKWARYRCEDIFGPFVKEFWAMRQEFKAAGNLLWDHFCKMLMNSLYGKFAQLSPAWVNCNDNMAGLAWDNWHVIDHLTGEPTRYRSFGWQIQKQVTKTELTGTFPAISAFITAAARCRMNELRHIAGTGNVYYQAVDSLIVNHDGHTRLRMSGEVAENQLGLLREQVAADFCHIFGCNDYVIGDKAVCSGRPKKADYQEVCTLQTRRFRVEQMLFERNSPDSVQEHRIEWTRQAKYAKGQILPTGCIVPLSLGESIETEPTSSISMVSAPAATMSTCG